MAASRLFPLWLRPCGPLWPPVIKPGTCAVCGGPKGDSLSYWHCQQCWEDFCAHEFDELMASLHQPPQPLLEELGLYEGMNF